MTKLCLTLLCPQAIEEKLLDLLLMTSNIEVFTSTVTAAHGLPSARLNQTEQVLGRAYAVEIKVIFSESGKAELLQILHQQFAGTGLRYWITAIVEAGEIV